MSTNVIQLPGDVESLHEELRRMVEEGRVEEARQRIAAAQASELGEQEADALRTWSRLLKPPSAVSKPRSGRGDFLDNTEWLRQNSAAYCGEWVALRDGSLVDHDPSFLALQRRLRDKNIEREVYCVNVDD